MVMNVKINTIHNGTGDKSIINKLHKLLCKLILRRFKNYKINRCNEYF